jgi:hypothetical protein
MSLHGSGTGTLTSSSSLSGGGTQTTSTVNGHATILGNFTGTLNSTVQADNIHTSGSGVLVGASGSQLDINYTGTYKAGSSVTTDKGKLSFTVTGGTGQFATATGSGTVTSTLDLGSGSLTFKINGKVKG